MHPDARTLSFVVFFFIFIHLTNYAVPFLIVKIAYTLWKAKTELVGVLSANAANVTKTKQECHSGTINANFISQ